MGASASPEGSLPGLPSLPALPAELPAAGPGISFTLTPNQTAPVTTGIGLGGNEPGLPFTGPPIPETPGPNSNLSQFSPVSNETMAAVLSGQCNLCFPGTGTGPTLTGGAGGVAGFGSTADTVTAANSGSAAGTISPNSSGAGQLDPFDPNQGVASPLTDAAGNFILPPGQAPFQDPQFPTTPDQFSPATLAGTGGLGDFFQTFLNRLADLFTRGFLVLLGVVLLAIAVWYFGARDIKATIVQAAR